jgi:aminoglycoside 3-N-acetyltransferase
MGILTEIFRRKKGVMRSLNPAHPILAFGPRAAWLIADHDKAMYSCGQGSPFEKALQLNAKVLFFDVSFRSLTFCHYLEDFYQENLPVKLYDDEPVECRVNDTDGNEIKLKIYVFSDEAVKRRNFRALEREMMKHNLMRVDQIGNTKLILVHLVDVADCAQKLVKSGKHLW